MTSNHKVKYGNYLRTVITVMDFVVINILFWITTMLNPEIAAAHNIRIIWLLLNISYFPAMYWLVRIHNQRTIYMNHVVLSAIQAVGIHALFFLSMLAFLSVTVIPWYAYLEFYGMCMAGLPLWWIVSRLIIKHIRRHGHNFNRVVIVGSNATALRLAEEMASDVGFGYRLMGFFDDDISVAQPALGKYLGPVDELDAYVRDNEVDEVYYTISGSREKPLHAAIKAADDCVVQFFYVPQIPRTISRAFELNHIGRVPVLTIRRNPLKNVFNRAAKRAFDISFSSIVLLFSPLVFIPVAVAIKLSSPGPVFFRQKRTGYRGKDFYCWKFRTMRVNAKADVQQAQKNDPRKTRIGEILRHTSIDELPQFINVFLGDMSVVGPRPHMLKHTADYSKIIDKYMVRHMVKPGITGWAQVNGYRGLTEQLWQMERRVEYDVWYIENWSFLLDLKIIVRTVVNAVKGESNAF